jgi:hypothetical protein
MGGKLADPEGWQSGRKVVKSLAASNVDGVVGTGKTRGAGCWAGALGDNRVTEPRGETEGTAARPRCQEQGDGEVRVGASCQDHTASGPMGEERAEAGTCRQRRHEWWYRVAERTVMDDARKGVVVAPLEPVKGQSWSRSIGQEGK